MYFPPTCNWRGLHVLEATMRSQRAGLYHKKPGYAKIISLLRIWGCNERYELNVKCRLDASGCRICSLLATCTYNSFILIIAYIRCPGKEFGNSVSNRFLLSDVINILLQMMHGDLIVKFKSSLLFTNWRCWELWTPRQSTFSGQ
jgi:hypothetical protein